MALERPPVAALGATAFLTTTVDKVNVIEGTHVTIKIFLLQIFFI